VKTLAAILVISVLCLAVGFTQQQPRVYKLAFKGTAYQRDGGGNLVGVPLTEQLLLSARTGGYTQDLAIAYILDGAHWTEPNGIAQRLGEHLLYTGLSVGFALLVAVPLGLAIGHTDRGRTFVIAVTSGWVLLSVPAALNLPVDPFILGALVIGFAAGALCFWGSTVLKRMLGYDDSLDAFGVHGVGGITGAILTGVFAVKDIGGTAGLIEGNGGQVVTQLIGVFSTLIYGFVASLIILKILDMTVGLRVTEEQEREGLDVSLHGESVE